MWQHPPSSTGPHTNHHSTSGDSGSTSLPPLTELSQGSTMEGSTGSPSMSDQLENTMPMSSGGANTTLPNLQPIEMDGYVMDTHSDTLEDSE